MNQDHSILRGKILFRWDESIHRFILQWCHIQAHDTMKEWSSISTDFPSAVEAIAYGKNLALKHLTEQGLGDALDEVEWWIKGDDTYYCPACLSPLAHEAKEKRGSIPQDVLVLSCDQGHTIPNIPADAFAFAPGI